MIKVSIVGGSGYAGGELLRILLQHPKVHINQVTSRQFAGQPVSLVHPNLRKSTDICFISLDQLRKCDVLIIALPNGVSMGLMNRFKNLAGKIIDLGADFRLHNQVNFTRWYHTVHAYPELLSDFVYGISEVHREEIRKAKYVSCAGCEATVSILSLYPLVKNELIENEVIIDAKMSSSQAGMRASLSSHHPERSGVVRSYMPTGHRHTAEIEQELSGLKVGISATAIDMVRGLLVTIHAKPKKNVSEKDIWNAYRYVYGNEPFIRIVKEKSGLYRYPEPKILQGTNYCDIGFELDQHTNRLVIIGAIDNLVKGTAGQAVQAMNIMFGIPEALGLTFTGLHPI